MSSIAERLVKLRKIKGLTVEQLSLKCGISEGTISNVETGKTQSPGYEILNKIVKSLELTPEETYNFVFGDILESKLEIELQKANKENIKLKNENKVLLNTIETLNNVINTISSNKTTSHTDEKLQEVSRETGKNERRGESDDQSHGP